MRERASERRGKKAEPGPRGQGEYGTDIALLGAAQPALVCPLLRLSCHSFHSAPRTSWYSRASDLRLTTPARRSCPSASARTHARAYVSPCARRAARRIRAAHLKLRAAGDSIADALDGFGSRLHRREVALQRRVAAEEEIHGSELIELNED